MSRISWSLLLQSVAIVMAVYTVSADFEAAQQCSGIDNASYTAVLAPHTESSLSIAGLPGFTRSVYHPQYAVIAPESRVWAPLKGWKNTMTAHLITPASGANFAMYLANLTSAAEAAPAQPGVERFVLVLNGGIEVEGNGTQFNVAANGFVFFPACAAATESQHHAHAYRLRSNGGAGLLVYERKYAFLGAKEAAMTHGVVDEQPLVAAPGEVFELRKLLPATDAYDFNIHVMDFQPGQHLNIKELHYNQHGLLMLQGQGIYRLADYWHPVQAGDAVWMAPFVLQWYAALGSNPTRYVIYKDTTLDPLFSA